MWFKYPIIIVLFLFISLLQNSFLQYFRIGFGLNLVFIMFFVLIFFEDKDDYETGFWISLMAGFFLDVFSLHYFGLSIVLLLVIYSMAKLSVYNLRGSDYKFSILNFAAFFTASLLIYVVFILIFNMFFGPRIGFAFDFSILFGLIYNLVFACAAFYIYKVLVQNKKDNQLRLF